MTERVPVASPTSKRKLEVRATELLLKFSPSVLRGEGAMDIEQFFELDLPQLPPLKGLKTGYADLAQIGYHIGAMGVTDASSMESLVDKRLADRVDVVGRRVLRATVGHEACHCLLHVPSLRQFRSVVSQDGPLFRSRHDIEAYRDPEWQAWGLCGALLMPYAPFKKMLEGGSGVQELAEFFDVNPAFVRRRKCFLGLQ